MINSENPAESSSKEVTTVSQSVQVLEYDILKSQAEAPGNISLKETEHGIVSLGTQVVEEEIEPNIDLEKDLKFVHSIVITNNRRADQEDLVSIRESIMSDSPEVYTGNQLQNEVRSDSDLEKDKLESPKNRPVDPIAEDVGHDDRSIVIEVKTDFSKLEDSVLRNTKTPTPTSSKQSIGKFKAAGEKLIEKRLSKIFGAMARDLDPTEEGQMQQESALKTIIEEGKKIKFKENTIDKKTREDIPKTNMKAEEKPKVKLSETHPESKAASNPKTQGSSIYKAGRSKDYENIRSVSNPYKSRLREGLKGKQARSDMAESDFFLRQKLSAPRSSGQNIKKEIPLQQKAFNRKVPDNPLPKNKVSFSEEAPEIKAGNRIEFSKPTLTGAAHVGIKSLRSGLADIQRASRSRARESASRSKTAEPRMGAPKEPASRSKETLKAREARILQEKSKEQEIQAKFYKSLRKQSLDQKLRSAPNPMKFAYVEEPATHHPETGVHTPRSTQSDVRIVSEGLLEKVDDMIRKSDDLQKNRRNNTSH